MAERDRAGKKALAEMTAEELELRLWERFFCPDQIDETVFRELEELREALDRKLPLEEFDPEEDWQRFLQVREGELAELLAPEGPERSRKPAARLRSVSAIFRHALIAAAILVLLAGAVLAADSLGLTAWIPGWNGTQYAPVPAEAAAGTLPALLEELGIREPVYPNWLPEGFVPLEVRYSEDPLILVERYSDNARSLSITVTPIESFSTTVYQKAGDPAREYRSDQTAYYLFENAGTITGMWYTESYAVSVSGNITLGELRKIIDSVYAGRRQIP